MLLTPNLISKRQQQQSEATPKETLERLSWSTARQVSYHTPGSSSYHLFRSSIFTFPTTTGRSNSSEIISWISCPEPRSCPTLTDLHQPSHLSRRPNTSKTN
jgi:hypothetical protein